MGPVGTVRRDLCVHLDELGVFLFLLTERERGADALSRAQMESGYALWDFKGAELQKHNLDKFKQLLWRPRPPTLLSKDEQKKIKKNLRDYSRQFEEQDQLEESNVSAELIALRKRLIEEWNSWRTQAKTEVEGRRVQLGKEVKRALRREEPKKEELEVVEEWVEEVVSETIELV